MLYTRTTLETCIGMRVTFQRAFKIEWVVPNPSLLLLLLHHSALTLLILSHPNTSYQHPSNMFTSLTSFTQGFTSLFQKNTPVLLVVDSLPSLSLDLEADFAPSNVVRANVSQPSIASGLAAARLRLLTKPSSTSVQGRASTVLKKDLPVASGYNAAARESHYIPSFHSYFD